ncbi:thermonuclease family protein [Bacillus subtilis]|uniref:thermonuclease family protein n=1 Tax=Bacillus subtilis TaxID=1423 RepID=UPI0021D8714B|nr:nuclease [Bacillus subtilis]
MKEKILITSLARANVNTPWRVGIFLNENYTFVTVGEKGSVALSPRFNMFLKEVEQKVSRYPVDISFHQIENNREMEITKIREQIVYIDCDFTFSRLLTNARFYYDRQVMGSPLTVNIQQKESETGDFSMFSVSENIASTTLDYVAIGRVEEVIDGDTIHVSIVQSTDFLELHGVSVGDTGVEIRYNGVDTPEKKVEGEESYKNPKNTRFGKQYGVTMEDMYEVGDEAFKYNQKILGWSDKQSQKPLVVLNFDRNKDGDSPLTEEHGRFLADVYATKEKNADILMGKVKKGTSFVHVCKSLLVEGSKKHPGIPLGLFLFSYTPSSSTVLNPFDWVAELGLKPIDTGSGNRQGMVDPSLLVDPTTGVGSSKTDIPENELNQDTINFSQGTDGPKSNVLDFFKGYDDRFSDFVKGIKDIEDLRKHQKVRIGDVILTIPPTSIDVNKTSNISKIKTLRTKSSVLVNRGQSLTTLQMDLYFHDLESINGTKLPWKDGDKENFFYVDGLRPLLAQFAKCPFVPIDNFYINDTLGIQDVALMDIEVTSVPNFPESLMASITLVEFNTEAYLLDHTLGESINYPMMRWYYNQSMDSSRGSKYRIFEGLSNSIKSDISFSLADEAYLQQRKNAISYLKSADSPEQYRTDLKTKNTTYQSKSADAETVRPILNQYKIYKEANIKKYSIIDYSAAKSIIDEIVDKYKIKQETAENAYTIGEDLWTRMYMGEVDSNSPNMSHNNNIYFPYETRIYYKTRFDYNWFESHFSRPSDEPPVDYSSDLYTGKEEQGLVVVGKMEDKGNQAALEKKFKQYYNEDKERFYIPASSAVFDVIKKIADGPKEMEKTVDEYEDNYNRMLAIVDASEEGVPMIDYKIKGTCIPTSINARFSNEFSVSRVQASEAASLQFMGGGDPALNLILEVDEDAAKDFSTLIAVSDRYAKEYSDGITNGFIGIKNDLAQLFGIKYIMFENIRISTVPNFPGRFQININALSFDKTQRQREELRGLPGNSQQMDLDMLESNKMAFANDRMLEARLHTLEVYPDLELPTYDEINAVLPHLDTGGCKEYKNLTGGLYLDPDFYFSASSTFRQLVEESYDGDHQLNMYDPTGVAAYTSSTDAEKLFNTTEENWDKLKKTEKTDGVEPLGWQFQWSNSKSQKSDQDTSGGVKSSEQFGKLSASNSEVQKFLTDTKDGKPTYPEFLSKSDWNNLFSSSYSFESYSKKPNGTEADIYKELDSLVDKYFKKYYSAPGFIEECRGDLKDADKSKKKVSYAPAEHFYNMVFWYNLRKSLSYKELKATNKLIANKTIVEPEEPDDVTTKMYGKVDGKPTKERFMTLMKAFLDKMSGWQHFKGKTPLVSLNGRVGLAQVDITGKDMTVEEVKRLMYNWRYNLDQAVKQLASHYEKLTKLSSDSDNFEAWCCPWDAMFALYEKPSKKIKTLKNINDSDFAHGIKNRFDFYAEKPFNTYSGFNDEIYKKYAGLSKTEKIALGGGTKDQIIESLLDLEYYDLSVLKDNGLKVSSEKKNIKSVMKKYLNTLNTGTLNGLYQNHLKTLYDLNNSKSKTEAAIDGFGAGVDTVVPGVGWLIDKTTDLVMSSSKTDKNDYEYSSEICEKGAKLYEEILSMDKSAENSTAAADTRLYNDVDPHMAYQEMFYEMRHHDQRGRMIRAFPGFQMFIIQEGSYFGKYKFWDNMYGYNAIQSIDVYRSRKIAADTALISMSNVYSNLSTRRTDIDFVDHDLKFWDNFIWNEIPQDLIDKKENEVHKNLYLETGARVHLRLGYAANAGDLPVVFNGTITEITLGDVVDIVAQGDGIELGNVISGDPDDDNDGLFSVTEPRDLICSMLSSKGSWMKDFFNGVSDGQLFRDNPLGIMHFGQPFDTNDANASKPLGNLLWFNDEYGEVAQNIYSSNGSPTFSQWLHPNGERNDIFHDFSWKRLWENKFKIFNPGDEKNVVVKFYNNTVWDVVQTIAYTSPDYIAAVMPFEQRSTLFFGKPYWRAAYQYDSRYEFDSANKTWVRHLTKEARRPYMQHHFYNSSYDIIENNIRASEDNVFTNVIVNYDGKQTPVLYSDANIRFDKQKTRVVEADIVAKFADYYTSEVMATYYGHSVLRDSMKDMYKGNLLVMGDPTVKPHDMMYIGDHITDLQGNALVKSVTHHFSLETGFVTSIEPDLIVVNDDQVLIEMSKWLYSFGSSIGATLLMRAAAKKATLNLVKWLSKPNAIPSKVGKWITTRGLRQSLSLIGDGSADFQAIQKTLDQMIASNGKGNMAALSRKLSQQFSTASSNLTKGSGKAAVIKDAGKKAFLKSGGALSKLIGSSDDIAKISKSLFSIVRGVGCINPVGIIVNTALWIGSEMLFEHYRRFKENLQCVVCIPLSYKGQELVAGINGHAGMVYGDAPGKYQKLFDATLFHDDGDEVESTFGNTFIELANFFTGSGGRYSNDEQNEELNDLANGTKK